MRSAIVCFMTLAVSASVLSNRMRGATLPDHQPLRGTLVDLFEVQHEIELWDGKIRFTGLLESQRWLTNGFQDQLGVLTCDRRYPQCAVAEVVADIAIQRCGIWRDLFIGIGNLRVSSRCGHFKTPNKRAQFLDRQ